MKKIVIMVAMAALGAAGLTSAQVYKRVPYGNNPFLFCKYGMPSDGWVSDGDGRWHKIVKHPNRFWIPTFEEVCSTSNGRDITPDPSDTRTSGRDPAQVP